MVSRVTIFGLRGTVCLVMDMNRVNFCRGFIALITLLVLTYSARGPPNLAPFTQLPQYSSTVHQRLHR